MSQVQPDKNMAVKRAQIFINNQFVNSISGKTFPTFNPATLEKIADVQEGDTGDINAAVVAAREAFKPGSAWRTMDASARGILLYKLADLIDRDAAIFATLETKDVGKPFAANVEEMNYAATFLRYYAGYADKLTGKTIPVDGNYFTYTRLEPIGVCGAILPWNYPMMLACWKLGPALAAGCSVVVKPAEQTPLSILHLCDLIVEAGFPPGVVNVVPGFGATAGNALAMHMDVDKISFTGSTVVGRKIMVAAAQSNLKKVTLELGGKSPNIVFADADLDDAVEQSHYAVHDNMGQMCTAGSRTFVQDAIYDEFVKKSLERTQKRSVGDPFDSASENGPQVNEAQFNKILSLIESGKKEGARLLCGGGRAGEKGYFIQPTLFADVTDDMQIAKEEIFGPVQQIIRFKNLEEVIPRANSTKYGLAASVFTKDLDKALTIANSVKAGSVWVNCYNLILPQAPFGGFKESGIGREHGEEGVMEYCEVKTVTIQIPVKNS